MIKKCVFLVLLLSSVTALGFAEEPLSSTSGEPPKEPVQIASYDVFARLPMLDHGRIKPLDTFARHTVLQLSGRKKVAKRPAVEWIAKLLFAPEFTREDKVFLIDHPGIVEALGITKEEKRRYSFFQLEPKFTKIFELAQAAQNIDEKQRDVIENEIIRLYVNLKLYSELASSFSFIIPYPDFTVKSRTLRQKLDLPLNVSQFTYYDIAIRANRIEELTRGLQNKFQADWTEEEQELVHLMQSLFEWGTMNQDLPLTIVPAFSRQQDAWFSPWDILNESLAHEEGVAEIHQMRKAIQSYWKGEQINFDLALKGFSSSIQKRLEQKTNDIHMPLGAELLYNKLGLFQWARLMYLFVFLVFLYSLIVPSTYIRNMALFMTVIGFLANLGGVILRIFILHRPPVSNLYETFIFVSLISVLIGLIIEWKQKQWAGILVSAISGFAFMTIASKYSMEGDTLQMLVAVLNSNFWLGTHVLTITIGYAGVCAAGIVGHLYLLQAIFQPKKKTLLNQTQKILLGTLGFGLTMTFLGTNLGGIWADQSWGRFWGWDPKENGALMIVIWCAILFHARLGKMIGPIGMAIGSALGIVVTMWAWFGVNLLSIGLHSYGFTSGIALNLLIYFIVQILFLFIAGSLAQKKIKAK